MYFMFNCTPNMTCSLYSALSHLWCIGMLNESTHTRPRVQVWVYTPAKIYLRLAARGGQPPSARVARDHLTD